MACPRMPPITAILHTLNDGLRLGRALETLRPCDEILVIDHGSTDHTLRIAREYGSQIHAAGPSSQGSLQWARHDWLLALLPSESLSEMLEAALFEWKLRSPADVTAIPAGATHVEQETDRGWSRLPISTRLIPRTWSRWDDHHLPGHDEHALVLAGSVLRFRQP